MANRTDPTRLTILFLATALMGVGCRNIDLQDCSVCESCLAGGSQNSLVEHRTGSLFHHGHILRGGQKRNPCLPRPYLAVDGYDQNLDKHAVRRAARRCARAAYKEWRQQTGEQFSKDFRSGFRQAYWDVKSGRQGMPPVLPPKQYWSAHNRTPHGHARAQQWFSGYQVGAELARQEETAAFNTIPLSVGLR